MIITHRRSNRSTNTPASSPTTKLGNGGGHEGDSNQERRSGLLVDVDAGGEVGQRRARGGHQLRHPHEHKVATLEDRRRRDPGCYRLFGHAPAPSVSLATICSVPQPARPCRPVWREPGNYFPAPHEAERGGPAWELSEAERERRWRSHVGPARLLRVRGAGGMQVGGMGGMVVGRRRAPTVAWTAISRLRRPRHDLRAGQRTRPVDRSWIPRRAGRCISSRSRASASGCRLRGR